MGKFEKPLSFHFISASLIVIEFIALKRIMNELEQTLEGFWIFLGVLIGMLLLTFFILYYLAR